MDIPRTLREAAAKAADQAAAAGDPTERYDQLTQLAAWHQDQALALVDRARPGVGTVDDEG